jgi:hypothetical protein
MEKDKRSDDAPKPKRPRSYSPLQTKEPEAKSSPIEEEAEEDPEESEEEKSEEEEDSEYEDSDFDDLLDAELEDAEPEYDPKQAYREAVRINEAQIAKHGADPVLEAKSWRNWMKQMAHDSDKLIWDLKTRALVKGNRVRDRIKREKVSKVLKTLFDKKKKK